VTHADQGGMRIPFLFCALIVATITSMLGGCDVEIDDVIPCDVGLIGSCPQGEACIEGTCRKRCVRDSDCDTCCLTADGAPDTCAPAEYCHGRHHQ
jgi:hypothetical protein